MKVLCIFVSLIVAIKAGGTLSIDGVPSMVSRIVDGEVAAAGAYPYFVGLIIQQPTEVNVEAVCGSSLVTSTRVVTAAHCVQKAASIEAVLGSQNLYFGGTRVETSVFVMHPNFKSNSVDYDIAYVVLPQAVTFSDTIKAINLPSTPEQAEVVGEWGMTVGYGVTTVGQDGVALDTEVRQLKMQVVSADQCKQEYGMSLERNTLCASSGGAGMPCGGDSGGPLVVERNGQKILVGVVSYGSPVCNKTLPVAFTRVATYLQFIQQT